MKPALALLLALPLTARADLIATVTTDKGPIEVILQYEKAPLAVANFITLSQGTRSRIDADTGRVINEPMYVGETFYRVVDNPTFKIAQTGSGTGNNSGGPGYTFKDEFDPSLRHVPYILSMANSGPNSNGSQIFFTGNATPSNLDDVHTVFGIVTDPDSQSVIDDIHAAGNDGSTITNVTISRTDSDAEDFDEHAQGLPVVRDNFGRILASNGAIDYLFEAPIGQGTVFRTHSSTTLEAWVDSPDLETMVGLDDQALTRITLTEEPEDQCFYHPSLSEHPGAVGPSSLSSRTYTMPLSAGVLTYEFAEDGLSGTTTYTPDSGDFITGPFNIISGDPSFDPNNSVFVIETPALNPSILLVKTGWNSTTAEEILGHHSTSRWNGFSWVPFADGDASLSR